MGGVLKLRSEAFTRFAEEETAAFERLSRTNVQEVEVRRDLIREGENPRWVYLFLEGWACRYKALPDGRRQNLAFFVPGDICDLNVCVLTAMDHSIGAITRIRVAAIEPELFQEVIAAHPRIARALQREELVKIAMQREWTLNLGQRTAYERIAHLLCEIFLRLDAVGRAADHSCELPLTQVDLADATGLTSVHVNRTLQELRSDGLIELKSRRLTIPDLEKLKSAALFNDNYLHLNDEIAPPAKGD